MTGKQYFDYVFENFLNTYLIASPVSLGSNGQSSGSSTQTTGTSSTTQTTPTTSTTNQTASTSTKASTTPVPGTYVSYIQYTVNCFNKGRANRSQIAVSGIYDSATASAVRNFQTDKKLNAIDAIVDSETKSILALFWLDLYKYNRSEYSTLLNRAPQGIQKYIQAAILYSDIEKAYDGSDSSEYRRISYTGIPGPTTIVDHIVLEVPKVLKPSGENMEWQEVSSLNIKAGEWPIGIRKVWMYEQDLGLGMPQGTGQPTAPEFNDNSVKATSNNIVTFDRLLQPNERVSIPLSYNRNIKYVMVEVYGNSLTRQNRSIYGPNAEGFSIKDINFTIKTPTKGKDGTPRLEASGSLRFTAVGTGTITGETNITSGDFGVFKLSSVSDANAYPGSSINQIRLNSLKIVANLEDEDGDIILDADGDPIEVDFTYDLPNPIIYSNGVFDNDPISFTRDGVQYFVNALTTTTGFEDISPSITSVYRAGGPTGGYNLSQSEVNSQFSILTNMAPIYQVVTTNGVEIESREYSREYEVVNYYVADADVSGLRSKQNTKLSINAKDGVVVLTDSSGNPIGLPNYSQFAQPQDLTTGTSIEISFGNTLLKWNLKDSNGSLMPAPDGLQWGFYNISTRQFLGKKFTYQYYMRNRRDIYIGLIAFDADRNAITTDNVIGIENRTGTLVEFQFPSKSICPIYSVIISDRAKIAVSNPPKDLSKFDSWFINVSRGRFFKRISIPLNRIYTDWKKDYSGQNLRCFYDTSQIPIASSSIFGSGYYDVIEENPIIVSRNEIKVRHGSFHVTQEILNKPNINTVYTDGSPIKVWIDIFIKDKDNNWTLINPDQIRTFNKHTGNVFFEKEIVPTDPKNIKVNYVVKNPNIMLHTIDKKEIPLNPFALSQMENLYEKSSISKPIHFYILPSAIQFLQNGEYIDIAQYQKPGNLINYTSDYSIFDPSTMQYNPLALYLGTATVNNKFNIESVTIADLRVKGGGISPVENGSILFDQKPNVLNFSDLSQGKGYLYPKGGYVIVKIPKEVKNNFTSVDEIYSIVRSNLTAGIAFDIQDMDGNDWRSI